MALPLGREDVDAILAGLFDANRKLDEIRDLLEDDGEEEEEDEPDA